MAKAKVRLKSAGVIALLNDPGVVAELERRMSRVSAAYGPSHIETHRHGDRTVVQVHSDKKDSFFREAHSGDLARAFDSAGGA